MLYPPLYRTAYQLLGPDLEGISVSLLNFYFWKGKGKEMCHLLTLFLNYFAYLRAYLLIPWSRVSLQNLTGSQLVKKFPAFYGTRRFITAFTSVRHLSLS